MARRDWAEAQDAPRAGTDTRERPAYYAQTLIAISIAHFQAPELFAAAAERMVETLTSQAPANGFAAVRMPGEGAGARRADWLANGVELRPEEWEMAMQVAHKRGFAGQVQQAEVIRD